MNKVVNVRLTAEEKASFDARAASHGFSNLSEYVRYLHSQHVKALATIDPDLSGPHPDDAPELTDDMLPVTQADAKIRIAQIVYAVFPATFHDKIDGDCTYSWHSAVAEDRPEVEIAHGVAEAIIATLTSAAQSTAAVPGACALVPREPTEAMIIAAETAGWDAANAMPVIGAYAAAWSAMLAAAPPPPAATVSPDREREIVERCAEERLDARPAGEI